MALEEIIAVLQEGARSKNSDGSETLVVAPEDDVAPLSKKILQICGRAVARSLGGKCEVFRGGWGVVKTPSPTRLPSC